MTDQDVLIEETVRDLLAARTDGIAYDWSFAGLPTNTEETKQLRHRVRQRIAAEQDIENELTQQILEGADVA